MDAYIVLFIRIGTRRRLRKTGTIVIKVPGFDVSFFLACELDQPIVPARVILSFVIHGGSKQRCWTKRITYCKQDYPAPLSRQRKYHLYAFCTSTDYGVQYYVLLLVPLGTYLRVVPGKGTPYSYYVLRIISLDAVSSQEMPSLR